MIFVRGKLQSNPVVLCYFSAELQLWDRINFELPSPPVSCPPYPSSSSDNDAEMATPSSLQKTQSQRKIQLHNTTQQPLLTLLPIPRNTNHSLQFASKNDRTSLRVVFSHPLSRKEEDKMASKEKRNRIFFLMMMMMEKPALKSQSGKEEEKRRKFFVFFLYGRIRSYLTSTSSFFVHQLMMMGSSGPIMEGIVVVGLQTYP